MVLAHWQRYVPDVIGKTRKWFEESEPIITDEKTIRVWNFNFGVKLDLEAMRDHLDDKHRDRYRPAIVDSRGTRLGVSSLDGRDKSGKKPRLCGFDREEGIWFCLDARGRMTFTVRNDNFSVMPAKEPIRRFRRVCRDLGPQVQPAEYVGPDPGPSGPPTGELYACVYEKMKRRADAERALKPRQVKTKRERAAKELGRR